MGSKKGAYLVDLVSGKRVSITVPSCKLVVDRLHNIKKVKLDTNGVSSFEINYDQGQYIARSCARHEQEQIFLNGTKLMGPRPINDGDSLQIGTSFLWFVVENQ